MEPSILLRIVISTMLGPGLHLQKPANMHGKEEYRCTPKTHPYIKEFDKDIKREKIKETTWEEIPSDHPYWKEYSKEHPSQEAPFDGLDPQELIKEKKKFHSTHGDVDLENTSRIEFSGGGSTLGFVLEGEKLGVAQQMFGDPSSNDDTEHYNGAWKEDEATLASVGARIEVHGGFSVGWSHRILKEEHHDYQTSISVELSDPDPTDYFVVDMSLDPDYGTYVFNTVAGHSRCPHEPGTKGV